MHLTQTHQAVRELARAFADQVIHPAACALNRDERFPAETFGQMADLGLFGIGVPEAIGGPGRDTLALAVVMEELSRGHASIADRCGRVELISTLLVRHGSMRQRALLPLALGTKARVACCMTGAVARAGEAVQVFGGSGNIRGFEVERLYRNARITQIYAGTNQIQRMITARELTRKGACG